MGAIRFHTLLSTVVQQWSVCEVGPVNISLFGVWPTLLLNRREFLLDRRLVSINRIYGTVMHLLMETTLGGESVSIKTLNRTLVMIITADRTSPWNALSRMIVRYYIFGVDFSLRYLGVVYVR